MKEPPERSRTRLKWQRPFFISSLGMTTAILLMSALIGCTGSGRQNESDLNTTRSITDRRVEWPSGEQLRKLVLLEEYNTRMVVLGVAILGAAAGLVGSFALLRKRALLSDALAHASLPGIAIAYLVAVGVGANAKSLPILLAGAVLSGMVGVVTILGIQNTTRIKQDTALGIVLSVFFGIGVALLGVCQQLSTGNAAGLESFIYGKTASMRSSDLGLIAVVSLFIIVVCVLFFKELKQLCFDEPFARSRGVPTLLIDGILMFQVVVVTMVGLQAVGLVLVVAMLVIPAAAARFWTDTMGRLAIVASVFGMFSGMLGAGLSDLFPRLPSGAMVVLVGSILFAFSFVFGTARGLAVRTARRWLLNRKIQRQHLLRGAFELIDQNQHDASLTSQSVSLDDLVQMRSWSRRQVIHGLGRLERDDLVRVRGEQVKLTQAGMAEAARLTRQHRLWELYLIEHADVAASRVDRDADAIEHVLEPELVDELERLLDQTPTTIAIPKNPHAAVEARPS
jgi:manganese/zinc/iron transport system permease protein